MSPRTQAVLIGGAFTGVLSALPIVSAGNVCCCLWVVGGGAVAAYLLQQSQPQPLEVGDGALVGCLAGVFGAFVSTLVSIPVQLVTGPVLERTVEMMRGRSDMAPEVLEMLDQFGEVGGAGVLAILVSFLFMLFFGVVFSTLGGVLGAVVFSRGRKDRPEIPA